MTSSPIEQRKAFVWTWLPGATEPVVAGRLVPADREIRFVYGRSYRERPDSISLYLPELPLGPEPIRPLKGLQMPGAIRDGAPDAWGRRVILNRRFGVRGDELDEKTLDELTFLLESGSDRVGALDFQSSASNYAARGVDDAMLDELLEAADRVEHNLPLTPEFDQALFHETSIGGARPKALLTDGETKLVAKFESSNDLYSVVKAEFVAMRLAALSGLSVAPVSLIQASGKDVLLIERFDRVSQAGAWLRRAMVSALTILELDEMQARYASYQDLAEQIRFRFTRVTETLHEMFGRISFNILVGNLDDHARNHAAFWDGSQLTLTPAYDICPQARTGEEASQAMLIVDQERSSRVATVLAAAPHFHLDRRAAIAIVDRQIRVIGNSWPKVCTEAKLGKVDRALLWGRQFLNPYAFYGLEGDAAPLAELAGEYRKQHR